MAGSENVELDYHVSFPQDAFSVTDDDVTETRVTAPPPENEPVVVLLGWLGCQEQHLKKYSDIYMKRRCITIQYTASGSQIFAANPKNTMKTIGYKLLELLIDLSVDDNPIIFHVFSNGGGMVYHQISKLLCSGEVEEFRHMDVVGCIFDSCPGERSLTGATRAFIAAQNNPGWQSYILGFFFFFYLLFRMIKMSLKYPPRKSSIGDTEDYMEYMMNEPSRWPQMYLYSKSDQIVSSKHIDKVVAHRKKLGVDVTSICWDDSPHVQHLRVHRESYVNLCGHFLQVCLAKRE